MAKEMTREQVKKAIREGRGEVVSGDIETVRNGSHIEFRWFSSRKTEHIQIENTSFANGAQRAQQAIANKAAEAGVRVENASPGGKFTPIHTGPFGSVSQFQGEFYVEIDGVSYTFPTLAMAKRAANTGNLAYGTLVRV